MAHEAQSGGLWLCRRISWGPVPCLVARLVPVFGAQGLPVPVELAQHSQHSQHSPRPLLHLATSQALGRDIALVAAVRAAGQLHLYPAAPNQAVLQPLALRESLLCIPMLSWTTRRSCEDIRPR